MNVGTITGMSGYSAWSQNTAEQNYIWFKLIKTINYLLVEKQSRQETAEVVNLLTLSKKKYQKNLFNYSFVNKI